MRLIDADKLLEAMETFLTKAENEARYTGIRGAEVTWNDAVYMIKKVAPTIEPERKKDTIQKFHDYQVEWLKSHYDIEFEPQLEKMIIRFLHDTANRYMMEEGGHG